MSPQEVFILTKNCITERGFRYSDKLLVIYKIAKLTIII